MSKPMITGAMVRVLKYLESGDHTSLYFYGSSGANVNSQLVRRMVEYRLIDRITVDVLGNRKTDNNISQPVAKTGVEYHITWRGKLLLDTIRVIGLSNQKLEAPEMRS